MSALLIINLVASCLDTLFFHIGVMNISQIDAIANVRKQKTTTGISESILLESDIPMA